MQNRDREEIIWEGTPSQWMNLGSFLLCALAFGLMLTLLMLTRNWLQTSSETLKNGLMLAQTVALLIPILVALWKWLQVQSHVYLVTTERIRVSQGILTRRTHEIELYRIRDVTISQSLFLRLFSLADLLFVTTDPSHPRLALQAIPNVHLLWDQIRRSAVICRQRQGISEIDFT